MASFDAALGAFLGAAVGDAARAVLLFQELITKADIEAAMRRPGGWHNLQINLACQMADNTEMAISLAQGLRHASPPDFPREGIAKSYIQLSRSFPFGIGRTTQIGMHYMEYLKYAPNFPKEAMEEIATNNKDSKDSGALIRITPLAIWGHALPMDVLARFAAEDAQLTHPHICCQEANAAYCIAIAHLIRHPGDNSGAISVVNTWMNDSCRSEEVKEWWRESQTATNGPGSTGCVRWGFVHAFKHLRRGTSYEEAIRQTLLRGDYADLNRDINAAIVGGLVGALHGASKIPSFMSDPVVQRCVGGSGRDRPDFLQNSLIPKLARELFDRGASYHE